MATYKPAAHIADIRGHIQNTTYSRNRLGNFMKIRKGPLDRRTLPQLTQRELVRTATLAWNNTLDATERLSWNNLGLLTTFMNTAGIQFHPSGYNLFLRQFLAATSVGLTPSNTAPDNAASPAPTFEVSFSYAGGSYITTDNGWCAGKTGACRWFFSPLLKQGRSTWSGPWRRPTGGDTLKATLATIAAAMPTYMIGSGAYWSPGLGAAVVLFKAVYESGPGYTVCWPQIICTPITA